MSSRPRGRAFRSESLGRRAVVTRLASPLTPAPFSTLTSIWFGATVTGPAPDGCEADGGTVAVGVVVTVGASSFNASMMLSNPV